ncbi:sensor histidine kinase [Microbacterium sp. USHLN186]|uniref:sensor histidine kinase n=1 Tax=Microbacterium sp. USHLN186 TaxID=3081286 RepID=UPI00301905A5
MTAHPGQIERLAVSSHWDRYGWLMAVVWMIFLAYPVIALLRSGAAQGWIATGWVALIVFAAMYVIGFVRGSRGGGGLGSPPVPGQWTFFAVLVVCAGLSVPAEGPIALSFLPFIMSFASYGLTRAAHWITSVTAVLITAACIFLLPGGTSYFALLVVVTLLGVVNTVSTWLIIRSAQAERLGIELATSEGREALARDVHDLIGHSLTVVQLKSQLAARLVDADPERAKAELAAITALTGEALDAARATVAGARSATLDEQLARSGEALAAGGVALQVEGASDALSPAQALTASWILRESTTNVLRHSAARRARVTVAPGRLVIEDDGRGLDGGETAVSEGSGIRGMRERAAAAGAVFGIGPAAGAGTRVEVRW